MRIKALAAVLISATLLLGGPTGMAVAHTFRDRTQLTLNVSDRNVDRGDYVVFSGRLKADHKECRAHRIVELYRDGVKVDQTQTNDDGEYRFRRRVFDDHRWQVRFGGFVGGTHPHSHTCKESESKRVKVNVRHR